MLNHVRIDNQTKKKFASEIMGNSKVQNLVSHLNSLSTNNSGLEVESAYKVTVNNENTVVVQLKNEDNTVRVHFQTRPLKIYGRVIVQEGKKQVAKIFDGNDTIIKLLKEYPYTEHFKNALIEIQKKPVPNFKEDAITTKGLLCIHGNWCGPLCSGPGSPVTKVDACCKEHDQCYDNNGYFDCECDSKLQWCLLPYVQEGSEWAILVFEYFNLQPCNE